MNTRIDKKFADLSRAGKKGFIAYITAGDPNLSATVDAVLRLEDAGVDIVELGLPFSDPLADGRVNQESAARALASGTTPAGVLNCIAEIRKRSEIPLLCYTYMNPFYAHGFESFTKKAARAGLDGVLFLDLPFEEEGEIPELLKKYRVNNIRLVTPTSPEKRIRRIAKTASGFIYCVSREGVTGMQKELNASARDLVLMAKKLSGMPVALGFGISTPAQAATAAADADAIVVGSAIVNRFHEEGDSAAGRKRAAAWIGRMVKAVKEI